MLTVEQLTAVFPTAQEPEVWAPAIEAAWQRFGFESKNSRAGYLGIIGNETGGLVHVRRENMGYTFSRALQIFRRCRENQVECENRCSMGPQAFASWVYANIIGNGDESTGDGWAFRGGGVIQLTGRANYRACGEALGIDLEANPDSLTDDPNVSAAAAAWFMNRYQPTIKVFLESDDETDFMQGAMLVGWSDTAATARRVAYRRKALEVLE